MSAPRNRPRTGGLRRPVLRLLEGRMVSVPPVRRWKQLEVKALREALRLDLARMARRLGVSPAVVARWEHGTVPELAAQARLDQELRLATVEQRQRFAALVTTPESPGLLVDVVPADDDAPGWVVHVHVQVADESSATTVARSMCAYARTWLVVAGLTTISPYGQPTSQRRVFCDHRVPGRDNRCDLSPGHDGACQPSTMDDAWQ